MSSRSHQTSHKRTRSASADEHHIRDGWYAAMALKRIGGVSEVETEETEEGWLP